MSFVKDLIANHKDELVAKIFDDELQKKIVTKLNENVNIPIISEKTEEKILNAIYDSVEEVVKKTIIDKL
tara:strand:- start:16240 stop:16449 length:210 start_codon:yes stop_codon:yes gene_type:complete